MSRSDEQKDLIYMPNLLVEYLKNLGGLGDAQIIGELSQESLPILVRYICKVLDQENLEPEKHFKHTGLYPSIKSFAQFLDAAPFYTQTQCEFPTSLEEVLRYSREIQSGKDISREKFVDLLFEQIEKLRKRATEFLKIRKVLDDRGDTIE